MKKIIGLCLIVASVPAYGVKIGYFNYSETRQTFTFKFKDCSFQSAQLTIPANSSGEYVPPVGGCCLTEIKYVKSTGDFLAASGSGLAKIMTDNGSGGVCAGYCALIIENSSDPEKPIVTVRGNPPSSNDTPEARKARKGK